MNIVQDVGGNNNGGDGNNDQSQPQPPPQPPSQPPPPPPPQRCPRCDSANTKFCYYNNYSLSQPRYFCKTCKRYWTQGGTLRNIPIGGGCRKGKRTKTTSFASSSSSISSAAATPQPLTEVTAALPAPRSLIGPVVGPMGPAYYQGGGYLSMIHSQNQLSQPLFNFSSSMNTFAPSSISSSSNLGLIHHAWLNAASSSRSNILPPPPPVATIFQSDESVYVSGDHNQQGGSMNMNMNMNVMMGNSGYGAASLDWSQNNNSLWSTVSTTSIGGVNNNSGGHINNGDQSNDIVDVNGDDKAGGSSSSLSGNPWSHLP